MSRATQRIGILTGGGDVPGLNACIKAAAFHATEAGCEMIGIRRGWGGLLNLNPDDPETFSEWIVPLDRVNTRTIDRSGGTFLHTSRTNPGRVAPDKVPAFLRDPDRPEPEDDEPLDFTPHVLKVLDKLGIHALIAIGGDDTLSFAHRLHQEGFPVVAIPKTMDNDVFGTDYCIGFSTAVSRSVEFITNLRTSAGSHERICIVELFGRNSGETSLISAYLGGVDRAIISEVHFDPERLAAMLMEDKRANPSNYAIMTISEGAQMIGGKIVEYGQADAYGHRKLGGIGAITGDAIKRITQQNIIYQQVAYLMRSGEPDALDRMVALSYGNLATDLLLSGQTGQMTALHSGRYATVPIDMITQGTKRVDVDELYDMERYRPKVQTMLGKPMFLY
ncbi:MAG TPA: 6-phosphofructokinase [Fimbriimonadaceae bacterium]|nr:6-phosphofructokinase [Fimbriimonadaceae bacterium]